MQPTTSAKPQEKIAHLEASSEPRPLKRTLIVSTYPPGFNTGGPIILGNLFRAYPADKLFVQCAEYWRQATLKAGLQLPCKHYGMPMLSPSTRYFSRIFKLLNIAMIPYLLARTIGIIRRHKIDIIFAVPSTELLFCAYFAHKLTGVPLYFYVMDDLETSLNDYSYGHRLLVKLITQGDILRASDKVWAICKYMGQHFESAYGVKSTPLPHCVDPSEYFAPPLTPPDPNRVEIVYTGSIYGPYLDAVRNLIEVIQEEGRENLHLKIYITLDAAGQARLGRTLGIIPGRGVEFSRASLQEIPAILRRADILYLPYSFEATERHFVSTSFPTKVAEYLAAGIPILVHAPPYASITRDAREYGWGLIVDTPDIAELRKAVDRLVRDQELRALLVRNAKCALAELHDSRRRVPEFLDNFREPAAAHATPESRRR